MFCGMEQTFYGETVVFWFTFVHTDLSFLTKATILINCIGINAEWLILYYFGLSLRRAVT